MNVTDEACWTLLSNFCLAVCLIHVLSNMFNHLSMSMNGEKRHCYRSRDTLVTVFSTFSVRSQKRLDKMHIPHHPVVWSFLIILVLEVEEVVGDEKGNSKYKRL